MMGHVDIAGVRPAATKTDDEGAAEDATGDGFERGLQLWVAGSAPQPKVPSVSRGVAGYVDDVEFRGGQSSDLDGNDATGRLRASWWCLRVPRGTVRMKTCSDAT